MSKISSKTIPTILCKAQAVRCYESQLLLEEKRKKSMVIRKLPTCRNVTKWKNETNTSLILFLVSAVSKSASRPTS